MHNTKNVIIVLTKVLITISSLFLLSCICHKNLEKNEHSECPILISAKFIGDSVTVMIKNMGIVISLMRNFLLVYNKVLNLFQNIEKLF